MRDSAAELPFAVDSETLFRRHAAFVASFLHRLGTRGPELDDLVQDVFMAAHRRGGYQPGAASPTTFLARLALEARWSHRRRDRRFREAQLSETSGRTLAEAPPAPDRGLLLHEAAEQMQRILDRMEPGVRAVFVLFELEEQSCECIAAGLDLKLGTVYSRLHKAREVFAAQVPRTAPARGRPIPLVKRPS
jgi:RNA polymerase sigma-70 factor (ECF subfamily)